MRDGVVPDRTVTMHILLDVDYNDTGSGSGSGDLGIELDEPCNVEKAVSPELQRIFLPVVYGLIFLLGITGNGLVVMVLGCQRRSKCSLTDRYRLHLSAADLLFVLSLPFWAADAALRDWRLGGAACVAVHVVYTVNLYGSVLILAFISLDRYLAVVRPTDTNTGGLRQLLASRLVYAGEWPSFLPSSSQHGPVWVAVFHLQLVLVALALPGVVLLVCYCVIARRLTRGPLGAGSGGGGQRQKRRAVRTTVALVLCFFACWLPYGAGITVDALVRLEVLPRSCGLDAALGVWLAAVEPLAFAHCCLNPLLYAFLGAGFKSSARRALAPLGRASSLRVLPRGRRRAGGAGHGASTTTESESSSLHSS
ncbi:hypothetical protein CRUP_015868 [Coryphaenoides rupestris]|nr:hypothetical protein CRUP_015868 [Coryphaenoides rupestris]